MKRRLIVPIEIAFGRYAYRADWFGLADSGGRYLCQDDATYDVINERAIDACEFYWERVRPKYGS